MWFEKRKKFLDGIKICEKLRDEEFEQVLKTINEIYNDSDEGFEKYQNIQVSDVADKERLLIIKTIYYIVQRLHIFILSPAKLQNDLKDLLFTNEKAQIILSLYSEISRPIITNLDMTTSKSSDEEVKWEIKTTLSDVTSEKCKIPKASICLKNKTQELELNDLNHSELSRLFDKLEMIQSELDNLNKS